MAKIEIDKEKNQVIIPLPSHKLSVAQRLTIGEFIKTSDIGRLTHYLQHFGLNKKTAPNGSINRMLIQDAKFKNLGKGLRADAVAAKKKGNILDKFYQKCDVFAENLLPSPVTEKYPAGRAVGVEIECYLPISREEVREVLAMSPIANVRCGTDSSINPDESSRDYLTMEFRVLTSIDNMQNLEKLCAFLKDHGARVNTSCGMHIHLDFRSHTSIPVEPVKRLSLALPMLKAMVPQSRLRSNYCAGDVSEGGRRSKINTEAFYKYRTIEVRLHSGTVNFRKISNWIKICHDIAFTEIPSAQLKEELQDVMAKPVTSHLDIMAKYYGWAGEKSYLAEYIKERVEQFNPATKRKAKVVAQNDNEVENEVPEIAKNRAAIKVSFEKAYEAWHLWYMHSGSAHKKLIKHNVDCGFKLQNVEEKVVKAELERQLEIKEGSIKEKDWDAFYSSFYMYDKKKRNCKERFPYLKLYFEKFPDLFKSVVSYSKKANAEELNLPEPLRSTGSSGELGRDMRSEIYGRSPFLSGNQEWRCQSCGMLADGQPENARSENDPSYCETCFNENED